jgi:hypothetical protein
VECVVTETHLLVAYILIGREAWIEAFSLPSATSPTLSRSHTAHCPFWFASATVLRSSISSPTQREVVLLVLKGQQGPLVFNQSELGLLHLYPLPDGTLSVGTTHVQTFDFALFNLCVSSSHGVARAIGYGASTRSGLTRYGFTISEDAQTGCAVSYTELGAEDTVVEDTVFDGFEGRLCFPGAGASTVEILDFA